MMLSPHAKACAQTGFIEMDDGGGLYAGLDFLDAGREVFSALPNVAVEAARRCRCAGESSISSALRRIGSS